MNTVESSDQNRAEAGRDMNQGQGRQSGHGGCSGRSSIATGPGELLDDTSVTLGKAKKMLLSCRRI